MNIDEILGLDSKAYDSNYNDYQNWKCITPLQAKQAIKEIVEGVLQMAADEAKTEVLYQPTGFKKWITQVDRQSILNVKDKITF